MKEKLLVILGPTATGKTDLALDLAKKFNGELVSCDSRQVYKGLDIGTGKLPDKLKIKKEDRRWIVNGINIWMYDVVSPKKQYSVADYVKDANRVVEDIRRRQKLPIIVGGTGFYVKALLEGIPNLAVPIDSDIRNQLISSSLSGLQKKLINLSPDRWQNLNQSDGQNKRRLIRHIELALAGEVLYDQGFPSQDFDVLKIGLTVPRQVLYERVDRRVDNWIEEGIIQEVEALHKQGVGLGRFRNLGLEYRVIADYLDGRFSLDEMKIVMQGELHGYVRRQQTWFKKDQEIYWVDITDQDFLGQVENKIRTWYHLANDTAD